MPDFKKMIEGMEEQEKTETPKQHTAKKEAPLVDEPKTKESEFSKSRPAFTHDFAESLRKDAINWANEKLPYDKSLPKILNNYTRDQVIDFMRGNIGEDEIMKRAKERNGINQDRVNLLAKQKADKKSLFDEYQLATPEGRKASSDFLKEMGIENVHKLTNEQYNDLAKKAMERFGIKDFQVAQEFIQSNDESDKAWDEYVYWQNHLKK